MNITVIRLRLEVVVLMGSGQARRLIINWIAGGNTLWSSRCTDPGQTAGRNAFWTHRMLETCPILPFAADAPQSLNATAEASTLLRRLFGYFHGCRVAAPLRTGTSGRFSTSFADALVALSKSNHTDK